MTQPATPLQTLRRLNDEFRRTRQGGRVILTSGLREFSVSEQRAIVAKVQGFDDFNPAHDPGDEHEFGCLDHAGQKIYFKIDYYDKDCQEGSPDATDPQQTTRVLTILRSYEF